MATYLCSVKSKACKRENATSRRIDKTAAQKSDWMLFTQDCWIITLKTSLKPPLPSRCNNKYRSFRVGWSLNLRDKMIFNIILELSRSFLFVTSGAMSNWCILRIIFVMDSLQLPNVQVSNALQMLQLCLDLCFFLHKTRHKSLNFLNPCWNLPLEKNHDTKKKISLTRCKSGTKPFLDE